MRGSVFIDTLKTSWRTTLLWGAGMAAFMWFFVLITPSLASLDIVPLLATLPDPILAAAGIQNIEVIGTVTGLLALGFFGKMAILFAAYPAFVGMRVTTNDEDLGAMDVVLSLPIPRWQMIVEKFLAYSVNIAFLVLMVIAGLFGGLASVTLDDIQTGRLVMISLNLIPVLMLVLAVTIFIGALVNRKQTVLMSVTAFIVVSYIVFTVGGMVDATWMNALEALSFFSYYNVEYLLENGVVPAHLAIMTLSIIAFMGGSLLVFNRRDIA